METGSNADAWLDDTRSSYDTVASTYADLTRDLLDDTPEERSAIASFADLVRAQGGGPVADLGCGAGRITAHLCQLGIDASGIDLSPTMIDVARRDHPTLRFEIGSMTDLALPDSSMAGLVAGSLMGAGLPVDTIAVMALSDSSSGIRAVIKGPTTGYSGQTITLDGGESRGGGAPLRYRWVPDAAFLADNPEFASQAENSVVTLVLPEVPLRLVRRVGLTVYGADGETSQQVSHGIVIKPTPV
ncbi:class I SAM-dependent DNA methyltransferase [Nocardia sp. NPDC004722]